MKYEFEVEFKVGELAYDKLFETQVRILGVRFEVDMKRTVTYYLVQGDEKIYEVHPNRLKQVKGNDKVNTKNPFNK